MLTLNVTLNEPEANLINIALDTLLAANQQRLQFAGGVSIVSAKLREALEAAQKAAVSHDVVTKPAQDDSAGLQAERKGLIEALPSAGP